MPLHDADSDKHENRTEKGPSQQNNLLAYTGFRVTDNTYIYGHGWRRLIPLRRVSDDLYFRASSLVGRLWRRCEIMVRATAEG
jgi:hypothetical protein